MFEKKGFSTSMFWMIYHFWNINNLHHILSIETLQIMETIFKKIWFNPNYCASFVIFQRYRIIVSSRVHPLKWLLRLWKFLKSLFDCNDEGWNIVKDAIAMKAIYLITSLHTKKSCLRKLNLCAILHVLCNWCTIVSQLFHKNMMHM